MYEVTPIGWVDFPLVDRDTAPKQGDEGASHLGSPKNVLAEDTVVGVLGVFDREAGPSHHRLEEPAERRVFVTNMFFEFSTAPSTSAGRVTSGAPGLDPIPCVGRVEVVDDIPKPEKPSWSKSLVESREGDTLPEVREMMEGVTGVDEVRWASLVLVGQKASVDDFDIIQPRPIHLGAQRIQHYWRDVHSDDPCARRCDGDGELPSAGSDVDDHGLRRQTEPGDEPCLRRSACVLLRVVPGHVINIKVLTPRAGNLVEQPAPVAAWLRRHACDVTYRVPIDQEQLWEGFDVDADLLVSSVLVWVGGDEGPAALLGAGDGVRVDLGTCELPDGQGTCLVQDVDDRNR